MSVQSALSQEPILLEATARKRVDVRSMHLLDVEILYQVWKLGVKAHHLAIMSAVEAVTSRAYHKQNFRRGVEDLMRRGYLRKHDCNIRSCPKGRSAKRRFEITDDGIGFLRHFRQASLSLAERLKEIP